MNHVQAVVAPVLLHGEVARVAVTSMNLNGQAVGFQAVFAGPAFGDWREHFQQQTGLIGGHCVACALLVHQPGTVKLQRQRAFAD